MITKLLFIETLIICNSQKTFRSMQSYIIPHLYGILLPGSLEVTNKRSLLKCGDSCFKSEDCVMFGFGTVDKLCALYGADLNGNGVIPTSNPIAGVRYYFVFKSKLNQRLASSPLAYVEHSKLGSATYDYNLAKISKLLHLLVEFLTR